MDLNPIAIFSRMPSRWRSFFFRYFYRALTRIYDRPDWKFMNFGYAPLEGEDGRHVLDPADEYNRSYICLYAHLLEGIPLEGKEILEVGCGRGGGADYITRYHKPKRMIALDLSPSGIAFCRKTYDLDGLTFQVGNAESLPFPDQSFDLVINVESSHCYGNVRAFFDQVCRVLRAGGTFLLTDFRRIVDMPALRKDLENSGLIMVREQDITTRILAAMDLEHTQRTALIEGMIPPLLRGFSHQFAGTPGSRIYDRFTDGESCYFCFMLLKNG